MIDRTNKSLLPVIAAALCLLLAYDLTNGAPAQAQAPAKGTLPPTTNSSPSGGDTTAEVRATRALLSRLSAARTDTQLAACLTDRSAAWVGFVQAAQIGQGIAILSGASAALPHGTPNPNARLAKDWDHFLHQYGTDSYLTLNHNALPPAIALHGRRFLAALEGFRHRLTGAAAVETATVVPSGAADDYRFTVLSPTQVRVEPPISQSPAPTLPIEARLEGGRWYLDMSDWASLSRAAGKGHTSASVKEKR